MKIPVIIDTDMAVDDWLAIGFLLQRRDVDIRAITVTADTAASCRAGVRNAMSLCALAHQPHIPVAAGIPKPLPGDGLAPGWRDRVDSMLDIAMPRHPRPASRRTAVDLLRAEIARADRPVLLTLGPLTNIAALFEADPGTAAALSAIYVMGGAVDVPGNLDAGITTRNTSAEWNIYVDPDAAAAVFAAGIPTTLIALDATNTAPLTMAFYARLGADRTTPIAEFAHHVLAYERQFVESGGWYFWDPLAAAAIIDPTVVSVDATRIKVVTQDGPEFGRTRRDSRGALVDVATKADAKLFERVFIDTLNGR